MSDKKGIESKNDAVGFDMADIETVTKANEGVWLALLNPDTGEPSSVKIKLRGYDSDVYMAWNAHVQAGMKEAMLQAMADVKHHKAVKSESLQTPDPVEALSQLVIDWENVMWNKVPLACTPENVKKVLKGVPAIRTQIQNFVEDRENFFAKASEVF
jgi:hypothetical protein